ncbi:MAG: tetratricopeptide repeat protein [Gemmatimonadaceae bacterium]
MHARPPLARLLLFSSMFALAATNLGAQANTSTGSPVPVTPPEAMMVPLTSASSEAKDHFMLGLRQMDIGAPIANVRAHFVAAVAADPSFALAHLYAALNAPTRRDYLTHLNHASGLAEKASPAERLMIRTEERLSVNDPKGALELARLLVQTAPFNPRVLQTLAGIQFALGQPAEARASLEQAIALAPRFAPAHIDLGNSYLQIEPKDAAKGEEHIRHAVDLEPNEPYVHDFMGDAYRAKNDLENARLEYTRMIELDAKNAGAFQQRGHVNSFLGKFAEARGDYDKSISLGDAGEKATFPVYRAIVNVYAGQPVAAEQELDKVVAAIDSLDLPDKTNAKIFALTNQLVIALHNGHTSVATRAVDALRALWRQQQVSATPDFSTSRQANIVYVEGRLAAANGDYAGTRAKSEEYMKVVETSLNPRKNERAHELLGIADLVQKNYASAAAHLAQANPNASYVTYQRALALEGAGQSEEAKALFKRVADTNFNSVEIALIKADAARRAK